MNVKYTKDFVKKANKLKSIVNEKQIIDRLSRFQSQLPNILREDYKDKKLNNHKLFWNKNDAYSINISFDIRALYRVRKDEVVFYSIWKHSQLYW